MPTRRHFLQTTTALAAAGCSRTTSTTPNASGGAGQSVNLVFRQFDPPTEIAGLTKAVDSWNAANPRIQVKLETLAGASDYAQQFSREANSGSGPDIVQLGFVNVKDLAKPKILLLDEPTTYLDITYQIELLELFTDLNLTGHTLVAVLHDLNHAARYATHLIAMRGGKVMAEGAPTEIVTADLVEEVFGLKCVVVSDPIVGTPQVVPLGRDRARM